ncbi:aldo/keto reductase [Corynebacterium sputi]|uniref:aldo/keto reductase n=1 Tax=Corynebacterium sputi TaxID=489915 RepID=UPI00040DB94F|nr:aldo/keto reductase [Corynebacterium sputi]
MTNNSPKITLNDGYEIPQIGLGTYKMDEATARRCVREAIDLGYRHIDTAAFYKNERGVGQAIKEAIKDGVVEREDLYVTTKIWHNYHGEELARGGATASLERLDIGYVDLFLVHWPVPSLGKFVETFEVLKELRSEGATNSVGVANFYPEVLDALPGSLPALNQIESHPQYPNNDQIADDNARGIATAAWAPLGRGQLFEDDVVKRVAEEAGGTPAQVVLRWQMQRGLVVIPKSESKERMAENLGAADIVLDDSQMAAIDGLADGSAQIGGDPRHFGEE